jgi:hypothetical protein
MCGNPRITCSRSVFHPPFEITHKLISLPQLYDKSERRLIAESGSQELSLVIHEPALAFLEHVVLTFLVIQKQRKSRFKMSQSFTPHSSESL